MLRCAPGFLATRAPGNHRLRCVASHPASGGLERSGCPITSRRPRRRSIWYARRGRRVVARALAPIATRSRVRRFGGLRLAGAVTYRAAVDFAVAGDTLTAEAARTGVPLLDGDADVDAASRGNPVREGRVRRRGGGSRVVAAELAAGEVAGVGRVGRRRGGRIRRCARRARRAFQFRRFDHLPARRPARLGRAR